MHDFLVLGGRFFCAEHKILFVLGRALYMKAIHGGKTKNGKTDSYKIAKLLRGGNLSMAYAYPAKMRATRDLLRRRSHMVNQCSLLVGHILNTNTQYNPPVFNKKLSRKFNHQGVVERFDNPCVRSAVQADLIMIEAYNDLIKPLEQFSSYARLIRLQKKSDGKWAGEPNKMIGNTHLKWAIRTAAMIGLRESEQAKKYVVLFV